MFLEKMLRVLRIWFLRMENRLLKITYLVRGIKEKNIDSESQNTQE